MSFENEPWLGVLLIVIGLAFALLAYAVLLNRDDDQEQIEEEKGKDEHTPTPEPSDTGEAQMPEQKIEQEITPQEEQTPQTDEVVTTSTTHSESEIEEESKPEPEYPPQPMTTAAPSSQGTLTIATLLRDETTGSLVLKIGETEYRRTSEIRDEALLKRLKFAAEDLSLWFASEQAPTSQPRPAGEEQPSKPIGMIEEINAILRLKLINSDLGMTGVRLVSDAGGGVKVYIGLDGYELDEVPNPEIRQLIQESVAEWEELQ
jgi:hypothetical protein